MRGNGCARSREGLFAADEAGTLAHVYGVDIQLEGFRAGDNRFTVYIEERSRVFGVRIVDVQVAPVGGEAVYGSLVEVHLVERSRFDSLEDRSGRVRSRRTIGSKSKRD